MATNWFVSSEPPVFLFLAYVNDGKTVIKRTKNVYSTKYDDDLWSQEYNRHSNNRQLGFFSAQHQPYKPLGEFELDPHRLVLDTLGGAMTNTKEVHTKWLKLYGYYRN